MKALAKARKLEFSGPIFGFALWTTVTWILEPAKGEKFITSAKEILTLPRPTARKRNESAWMRSGKKAELRNRKIRFFAAWDQNQTSEIQRIDLKKDENITLRPKTNKMTGANAMIRLLS